MNQNTRKKRKKKFYKQFSKKQKYGTVQPGVFGILITCNNNEKRCVREAYNILNEYGDRLFGPEASETDAEDRKDVESELELELQNLKSKTKRFQQLDTKVSNCLFIRTEVNDPSQLVYDIFEDIQKSQIQKTRCILRMLPILITCKAYLENIEKSVEALLDKFKDNSTEQTFSIIVKIRHNNSIGREAIVASIYRQISQLRPTWKADLKFFKLAVVVEILHTVCCLGIAKDYLQFRKYNLAQITELSSKQSVKLPEEEKDEASSSESEDVKNDMPTNTQSLKTDTVD
ncbi:THUMP domain-containing protein 1 [Centruroides vittatus]|uniref:THUMP domain-containing protein 1 n=1 Tax=Centruroides vittatus TaxID=120091 RepID=UPI00350F3DF0